MVDFFNIRDVYAIYVIMLSAYLVYLLYVDIMKCIYVDNWYDEYV
jgi:hypothetical protein